MRVGSVEFVNRSELDLHFVAVARVLLVGFTAEAWQYSIGSLHVGTVLIAITVECHLLFFADP